MTQKNGYRTAGETDMELIVMIIVLIVGLAALDGSSLRWGVDSRPPIADDHAR
jgi:hypothetical protein